MTRAAGIRKADIANLISGAIKGGWPVGSFKLVVENGAPTLLPANGGHVSAADDCERRMKEAFGEDVGANAIRR